MNNMCCGKHGLLGIGIIVILLACAFLLPWRMINWGTVTLATQQSITVMGEARSQEKNQIASFNAGVSAVKDNKQSAVDEVNGKITAIIDAAKTFGIPTEDIQTQSISVYQEEETYYDNNVQKRRPGQWRVNNSVEFTLRKVDKAADLADILSKAGATNVYGPNFTMDDTRDIQDTLLAEAVTNAQKKAELIARGSGKKIGKIISVSEGSTVPVRPVLYDMAGKGAGGGGGSDLEPGTATISESVTVVFELLD